MAIVHIHKMKHDDLKDIMTEMADFPSKYEVSEKIDGSLNAALGIDKDGVYFCRPSKGQPKKIRHENGFPSVYRYNGHRFASESFYKVRLIIEEYMKLHSITDLLIECEVLHTKRPNVIQYNMQGLVFLKILTCGSDKRTIENKSKKTILKEIARLIYAAHGPKISISWNHFEMKKEEDTIVNCLKEHMLGYFDIFQKPVYTVYDVFPTPLRHRILNNIEDVVTSKIDQYKYEREIKKLTTIMLERITSKLIKNCEPEGIVITELNTGKMFKLVDTDKFTKMNNFIWDVRSMIEGGRIKNGIWRKSIHTNFVDFLADNIIKIPFVKTPGAKKAMRSFFRPDIGNEKWVDMCKKIIAVPYESLSSFERMELVVAIGAEVRTAEKSTRALFNRYKESHENENSYCIIVHKKTLQAFYSRLNKYSRVLKAIDDIKNSIYMLSTDEYLTLLLEIIT